MTPGDDLGRFRYLELWNIHVVLAVGLELNFRKSPYPPLELYAPRERAERGAAGRGARLERTSSAGSSQQGPQHARQTGNRDDTHTTQLDTHTHTGTCGKVSVRLFSHAQEAQSHRNKAQKIFYTVTAGVRASTRQTRAHRAVRATTLDPRCVSSPRGRHRPVTRRARLRRSAAWRARRRRPDGGACRPSHSA